MAMLPLPGSERQTVIVSVNNLVDGVSDCINLVVVLLDRLSFRFFRVVAVGIEFVDRVLAGVKDEELSADECLTLSIPRITFFRMVKNLKYIEKAWFPVS
jgi:hypothetical protein